MTMDTWRRLTDFAGGLAAGLALAALLGTALYLTQFSDSEDVATATAPERARAFADALDDNDVDRMLKQITPTLTNGPQMQGLVPVVAEAVLVWDELGCARPMYRGTVPLLAESAQYGKLQRVSFLAMGPGRLYTCILDLVIDERGWVIGHFIFTVPPAAALRSQGS